MTGFTTVVASTVTAITAITAITTTMTAMPGSRVAHVISRTRSTVAPLVVGSHLDRSVVKIRGCRQVIEVG